ARADLAAGFLAAEQAEQDVGGHAAHFVFGLSYGGEGRIGIGRQKEIVEPHNRDVIRYAQAVFPYGPHCAERLAVVVAENGGWTFRKTQQIRQRLQTTQRRPISVCNQHRIERQSCFLEGLSISAEPLRV